MQATQQMTDNPHNLPAAPSRQAIQAKTASKPGRVTGKLAAAIDKMIEDGTAWDTAAGQAGLTVRSMRLALERPHVIQYIKAKREVFRTHACAANIHRLVKMRDQDENKMAVVQAIKALEQIGDDVNPNAAAQPSPGMVIVIVGGSQEIARHQQIDAIPLNAQQVVSNGD